MKGIDISCTSQNSTAVISSSIEFLSPSSSSFTTGGRAIDRYNPIIADEKRSGAICRSTPTTPCAVKTPVSPSMVHERKKKKKKKSKRLAQNSVENNNNMDEIEKESVSYTDDDYMVEQKSHKSFSKPADVIMETGSGCTIPTSGVDYISMPESSRYLLDDTSFLDVLSDFDPVVKLVPFGPKNAETVESDNDSKAPKLPSSLSSGSSEQEVVLRVSLHCRGCERKLKKHLSRMPGVKSFNIDFLAKKVTVVGDVTPLGVLSNISKVKNAQLWTPTLASSCPTKQESKETTQPEN